MKNLLFSMDLDSRVSIYVPSTFDVDTPVNNDEYVNRIMTALTRMFGGATSSAALGCWMSEKGELVKEKICIVYSNCTSAQLREHAEEILDLCIALRDDMKQECVTLEVNGQIKFI